MENTTRNKNAAAAGTDDLCRNYEGMSEAGKRKLQEVSEKILNIWKTVNGGCSSGVEFQIVDLAVAGSKPVIHPDY